LNACEIERFRRHFKTQKAHRIRRLRDEDLLGDIDVEALLRGAEHEILND
jgi:hypothetical protein